jgi:hypothetical protein
MFIFVTEAVEREVDLSFVTDQLDKDHIMWFEIPAGNNEIKNGRAIARWISDDEFAKYRLEDEKHGEEMWAESEKVENWLKERHGHIIDST